MRTRRMVLIGVASSLFVAGAAQAEESGVVAVRDSRKTALSAGLNHAAFDDAGAQARPTARFARGNRWAAFNLGVGGTVDDGIVVEAGAQGFVMPGDVTPYVYARVGGSYHLGPFTSYTQLTAAAGVGLEVLVSRAFFLAAEFGPRWLGDPSTTRDGATTGPFLEGAVSLGARF